MTPHKTEIILGPPGTGKTTSLITRLEQTLRTYEPERVCYISYTRKATQEAVSRCCSALDLDPKQLPLFRTLHSLAYEYLRIKPSNIMLAKNYFEFAKEVGTFIKFTRADEYGNPEGMAPGNVMLAVCSRAKNNEISLEQAWEELDCPINFDMLSNFHEKYNKYKLINHKMDFDDIIVEYAKNGERPFISVLFIDEAQDLSKAQWKMAERLEYKTIRNYIAGDDDQSIYEWAGADTQSFIDLDGKTTVLNQSYRVPSKIHELSTKVLSRIKNRREKEYKPKEEEGQIIYESNLLNLPIDNGEEWLLLARNNSMLGYYEQICKEIGIFYNKKDKDNLLEKAVRSVQAWQSIQAGGYCNGAALKDMYDFMSNVEKVKYGSKGKVKDLDNTRLLNLEEIKQNFGLLCSKQDWQTAFDKMDDSDKSYIENALSNGCSYDIKVTISTIHGVKGGEAQNVALFLDMSPNTFNAMKQHEDQEHRVWYVGLTRTKQNLYLLTPQTNYYYEL